MLKDIAIVLIGLYVGGSWCCMWTYGLANDKMTVPYAGTALLISIFIVAYKLGKQKTK